MCEHDLYGYELCVEFEQRWRNALCVKRDANLMILGERIRTLRKERGLSQEKLAELSEVHRNFIGFIERGERNVGVKTVIALAQAMELPPASLFAGCEFEPVIGFQETIA